MTDTPQLPFEAPPESSELPGPYEVGKYAAALREQLRGFVHVQLVGEIANLRPPTRARAYFELRDAAGAIPCAMWRNDWDRLGPLVETLSDGAEVVVSGGCDYYPGSASASPAGVRVWECGDAACRATAALTTSRARHRSHSESSGRTFATATGRSGVLPAAKPLAAVIVH